VDCGGMVNYIYTIDNNTAALMRSTNSGGTQWTTTQSGAGNSFFGSLVDPVYSSNRVYLFGLTTVSSTDYNFYINGSNGGTSGWESPLGIGNSKTVYSLAIDSTGGVAAGHSQVFYVGLDAGSGNGGIWKSSNTGSSWSQWSLPGGASADRKILSVALNTKVPGTVYAGGIRVSSNDNVCLWKTTNSGTSWSAISGRTDTVKKILMHPSYKNSANYLWVIAADGRKIYKSADGGTNWTDVTTIGGVVIPTPINDLRRDISDSANIYVACGGGVYKVNPSPEAPLNLVNATQETDVHPKISWDASPEADVQSYKVYKKINNGSYYLAATTTNTYWIDQNEIMEGGDPYTVTYFVKAYDTGSNFSDASNTVEITVYMFSEQKLREGSLRDLPKEFSLEQNFPNPFNPTTTIKFALPVDANVTMKVFNSAGQEVAVLVNGFREAGFYEIKLDAKKLASGVYFYKLTAGNYSEMKKMALMK
ncbi:MAG: T9SS type A sorting domain-containing protein, partial [Bacteroidota bacterium]